MTPLLLAALLTTQGQLPLVVEGEDHFTVTEMRISSARLIDADNVELTVKARLVSDTPVAWRTVGLRLTNLPAGVQPIGDLVFHDVPSGVHLSPPTVTGVFVTPRVQAKRLRKFFRADVFETDVVHAVEETLYTPNVHVISTEEAGCAAVVSTSAVTGPDGLPASEIAFDLGTAPLPWVGVAPNDVIVFSADGEFPCCEIGAAPALHVPNACVGTGSTPFENYVVILDNVIDPPNDTQRIVFRALAELDQTAIVSGVVALHDGGDVLTQGGSTEAAYEGGVANGTISGAWPARPIRQLELGPDLALGGHFAIHDASVALRARIRGGQLRQVGVDLGFDLDSVMLIRASQATTVDPNEFTFLSVSFPVAGAGLTQTALTLELLAGGEGVFSTAAEVSVTRNLHVEVPAYVDYATNPPTFVGEANVVTTYAGPVEPTVVLEGLGSADVWVGARLGLAQQVGPLNDLFAEVGAYGHVTLDVDTNADPVWSVDSYVDSDVVFGGHVFGFEVDFAQVALAPRFVDGARAEAVLPAFADGPRAIGNQVRWATGFSAPGGNASGGVVALSDGGALILSAQRAGIARVDARGEPVFGYHAVANAGHRNGYELDDGRVLLAGQNSGLWLLVLTPDGQFEQRVRFNMTGTSLFVHEMHITPLDDGLLDAIFTGQALVSGAYRSFAARGLIDPDAIAAAEWLWSMTYDDPQAYDPAHLRLHDSLLTDEGRLIVVGVNHRAIPVAPPGTSTSIPGAFSGTIDVDTGVMVRGQQHGTTSGARLNSLAQGPTGQIVAVGFHGRTAVSRSTLVMPLDPDGVFDISQASTWAEDLGWSVNANGACCAGEIPFGATAPATGDTAYDEPFEIVAYEGGFLIGGITNITAQGWLIGADPDGDVRWFQRLSGPGHVRVDRLAAVDDGIFVFGYSTAPTQGGLSTSTTGHLIVTRAPFEGLVENRIPGSSAVMAKAGAWPVPSTGAVNGLYAATYDVDVVSEPRAMESGVDTVTFQTNVEFVALSAE